MAVIANIKSTNLLYVFSNSNSLGNTWSWRFCSIYFKRKAKQNDKTQQYSFLTKEETEKADEVVLRTLEALKQSSAPGKSRGKYNWYTGKQRAQIGKYAVENRLTRAAKHFAALWKVDMNKSTARRLKTKYLEKMEETMKVPDSDFEKDEAVATLPKCKQGRYLLLGKDLDIAVQEYLEIQRTVGTSINLMVAIAAAEGIISMRDMIESIWKKAEPVYQ